MTDITQAPSWMEIIGISSLVAAGVTAILGLIKDFLIERYRFKKQITIEYIEKQINLYSQLYYLIEGGRIIAGFDKERIPDINEEYKKFNSTLMNNSKYFHRDILKSWYIILARNAMLAGMNMDDPNFEDEIMKILVETSKLKKNIQDVLNNELIPVYKKFAGKTVPLFID